MDAFKNFEDLADLGIEKVSASATLAASTVADAIEVPSNAEEILCAEHIERNLKEACEKCKNKISPALKKITSKDPPAWMIAQMIVLQYDFKHGYNCHHKVADADPENEKLKEICETMDLYGWEIIYHVNTLEFHCTLFRTKESKKLLIIDRGTNNLRHLYADLKLALQKLSLVDICDAYLSTAECIKIYGLDREDGKYIKNDYEITIAGHSLGGWLSQLTAFLFAYPDSRNMLFTNITTHAYNLITRFEQYKDVFESPMFLHCVTLDNPGALNAMTRLDNDSASFLIKANWLLSFNSIVEENESGKYAQLDINIYLSNRNLVNTCGAHCVTRQAYQMDILENNFEPASVTETGNAHSSQSIADYLTAQKQLKDITDTLKEEKIINLP